MIKQITVIIYIISDEGIVGHRMQSKEFWIWTSKREASQEILWELVNEMNKNEAITNIQIF